MIYSLSLQVKQIINKSVSWVRVRDDHILTVDRWEHSSILPSEWVAINFLFTIFFCCSFYGITEWHSLPMSVSNHFTWKAPDYGRYRSNMYKHEMQDFMSVRCPRSPRSALECICTWLVSSREILLQDLVSNQNL